LEPPGNPARFTTALWHALVNKRTAPVTNGATGPTVLVIDDEPHVRDVLRDVLSEERYAVKTARSGVAGLTAIEVDVPDAVLLDITMPGFIDGVGTLRGIKRVHPDLPVIMVTGNADEELAKTTLHEGAFDYLMKPFDLSRLAEVLSNALLFSGRMPPAR
jgi:two-component system nitrogen regulation response regulator NtrX